MSNNTFFLLYSGCPGNQLNTSFTSEQIINNPPNPLNYSSNFTSGGNNISITLQNNSINSEVINGFTENNINSNNLITKEVKESNDEDNYYNIIEIQNIRFIERMEDAEERREISEMIKENDITANFHFNVNLKENLEEYYSNNNNNINYNINNNSQNN